jgi:predicted lipase
MRAVVSGLMVAVLAATASAQFSINTAWSALHYSKAAYCDSSTLASWSCGSSCEFFPNFQIQNVYDNPNVESQAYSGYDSGSNTIIVAFRGSSNIPNWISDLDFVKTTYTNAACGCEVHAGFLGEWQSYSAAILADVQTMVTQYNAPVFVTGHSLGAAVSILAAMDIITQVTASVTLYNFGEPRVGDSTFAAWASAQLQGGKQFRVTHERDPVPHVPPMDFGFLHCPHELWFNNDGNSQWQDCADSGSAEDPTCSDSEIPWGIEDHLLYLGICTECTCDSTTLIKKYGVQKATRILARISAGKNTLTTKK